jgi:hypothetical protein
MLICCQFCYTLAVSKVGEERINHCKNTCSLAISVEKKLCYDCALAISDCICGSVTAATAALYACLKTISPLTAAAARATYGISDAKFDGAPWNFNGKDLWLPTHLMGMGPFVVYRNFAFCRVYAAGSLPNPLFDKENMEVLAFEALPDALMAACSSEVPPKLGNCTLESPAPPSFSPFPSHFTEEQKKLAFSLKDFLSRTPGMVEFIRRGRVFNELTSGVLVNRAGLLAAPLPVVPPSNSVVPPPASGPSGPLAPHSSVVPFAPLTAPGFVAPHTSTAAPSHQPQSQFPSMLGYVDQNGVYHSMAGGSPWAPHKAPTVPCSDSPIPPVNPHATKLNNIRKMVASGCLDQASADRLILISAADDDITNKAIIPAPKAGEFVVNGVLSCPGSKCDLGSHLEDSVIDVCVGAKNSTELAASASGAVEPSGAVIDKAECNQDLLGKKFSIKKYLDDDLKDLGGKLQVEVGEDGRLICKARRSYTKCDTPAKWMVASHKILKELSVCRILTLGYLDYMLRISVFADEYEWHAVLLYDKLFRAARQEKKMLWDTEFPMLVTFLVGHQLKRSAVGTENSNCNLGKCLANNQVCWEFNGVGCQLQQCNFAHKCQVCNGDHPKNKVLLQETKIGSGPLDAGG